MRKDTLIYQLCSTVYIRCHRLCTGYTTLYISDVTDYQAEIFHALSQELSLVDVLPQGVLKKAGCSALLAPAERRICRLCCTASLEQCFRAQMTQAKHFSSPLLPCTALPQGCLLSLLSHMFASGRFAFGRFRSAPNRWSTHWLSLAVTAPQVEILDHCLNVVLFQLRRS